MYNVSFPGLGIENLEISRIAFSIGDFHIYWYGILITVAVLLTMLLASRRAPRYGLRSDDIYDYFLWLIPAMLVFARLFYVVFAWDEFDGSLTAILDTRSGGLAFYGGVIGGLLSFIIVSKVKKIRVSHILDFVAPYIPLGQAIGRWGNFFNQEAFGTNTDRPWGMISEGTTAYLRNLGDPALDPFSPVHPTFLYEFLGNMVIFAVLLYLRRHRRYPWQIVSAYLFLYGILRFFVEGIRTDALFIGNTDIRVSQLLSFLMVLGSIVFAIYMRGRHRRHLRLAEEAVLRGETVPDEASGVTAGWPVTPGLTQESEAAEAVNTVERDAADPVDRASGAVDRVPGPAADEPELPAEPTVIDHTESDEPDHTGLEHTDPEDDESGNTIVDHTDSHEDPQG